MLTLLATTAAWAEDRCKFNWESAKGEAKYTQQMNLDVGDIGGHKIGVFEVHRTNPDFALPCANAKVVEQWSRGFRDAVDRNGRAWGYDVLTLNNGDKIFVEWSGTTQTEMAADGTTKTVFAGAQTWTGGTGRYASIRGIVRAHVLVEYAPDSQGTLVPKTNEAKFDGEYWFEK
jgi:hypothetical protein